MEIGRWLIVLGLTLVLMGAVLYFFPRLFAWFGHLPGDIRIERDGVYIFVPLTSMLVVSVLLSLFLNLLGYLVALLSGPGE